MRLFAHTANLVQPRSSAPPDPPQPTLAQPNSTHPKSPPSPQALNKGDKTRQRKPASGVSNPAYQPASTVSIAAATVSTMNVDILHTNLGGGGFVARGGERGRRTSTSPSRGAPATRGGALGRAIGPRAVLGSAGRVIWRVLGGVWRLGGRFVWAVTQPRGNLMRRLVGFAIGELLGLVLTVRWAWQSRS